MAAKQSQSIYIILFTDLHTATNINKEMLISGDIWQGPSSGLIELALWTVTKGYLIYLYSFSLFLLKDF
jgi:hypothetical protein